jgi:cytochrome c-type biogenesis protein CcmF
MLAEIGIFTTGLAFFGTLVATVLGLVNAFTQEKRWATSARNTLLFVFGLLTLACLVLVFAQWTGDYSIAYVKSVSSESQPEALKITALWGSQAGSLLFYSWMLSLFISMALLWNWKSQQRLMGWVIVIAGATLAFFLMLNVFFENAFERTWIREADSGDTVAETALFPPEDDMEVAYPWRLSLQNGETLYPVYGTSDEIPPMALNQILSPTQIDVFSPEWTYDGVGLNPLLRHPGMIIHPPMLYLGFTGFMLPFAFGMAALIIRQTDTSWMHPVRRWSLVSWMFLSVGLILGGRWAYDVLGWGGYWGWDPVENAALLPWFTGTAFLHSVMIQEKRGMLKGWNMTMIIATYLLVLLGTVATRTGLLSSVHTFAQSPLAIPMGGFLGGSLLVTTAVYFWRGNQNYFKGDHEIEGVLSRESMFMLNNWVFLALTIVVFWGTWAEKITDFAKGLGLRETVINLGPEYYELPVGILFLIIFVLMGVAPLVAWRRATAERLGRAMLVPTAMTALLMVFLVIIGTGFWAVLAYGVVAFAGFATLLEIWKGVEARHRAHRENWGLALIRLMGRNRRRYGGYIIHLGVVVIGIGVIGSQLFQNVDQANLRPGETVEHAGYVMRFDEGSVVESVDGRLMQVADVTVFRDGEEITALRPRIDIYPNSTTTMRIAGVHSTIEGDFYTRINFIEGDRVLFALYYNPLINLVWWGGILMVVGTLVATWPEAAPSRVRMAYSRTAGVRVPAGAGD